MIISIIAAMDRNRLIGDKNRLPWHLPAELAHFKKITMGKPIVMGRKTFESIGRPLPGRTNIVLTHSADYSAQGVEICTDPDAIADIVPDADEVMIIGGGNVYRQMLPRADRLYLTYVDAEFSGDAWFPEFDPAEWKIIEDSTRPADEKNPYTCRFVTCQRL